MDWLAIKSEARRRFPGFSLESRIVELDGARIQAAGPVAEGVTEATETVEMEDLGEGWSHLGGVSMGYCEALDTLLVRRG